MTELGARLKEARTAKGYSLEDLQEITKIQKRYLAGIEEGNYSSMPGSFYVRAFIKQYAEAVGLDPNEILEQYRSDIPSTQATEVAKSFSQSHNRRTLAKSTSNSRIMESVPKIIVGLFAVVILIIAITLVAQKMNDKSPVVDEQDGPVKYETNPTTKDPLETEPTEEEEPTEETEPTEEEEPVSNQVVSEPVQSGKETFSYNVSGTDQLKVRVEMTTGPSWVGAKNIAGTGILIDAKVYNAGEVVEFDASADKYVNVRLGRALSVKFYINDQEVVLNQQEVSQNIIINLEEMAQQ